MLALSLGVYFPADDFLLVHMATLENTLTVLITAFGYFILLLLDDLILNFWIIFALLSC